MVQHPLNPAVEDKKILSNIKTAYDRIIIIIRYMIFTSSKSFVTVPAGRIELWVRARAFVGVLCVAPVIGILQSLIIIFTPILGIHHSIAVPLAMASLVVYRATLASVYFAFGMNV